MLKKLRPGRTAGQRKACGQKHRSALSFASFWSSKRKKKKKKTVKRRASVKARGQKHRSALFIHLLLIFKGVHELPTVGIASF